MRDYKYQFYYSSIEFYDLPTASGPSLISESINIFYYLLHLSSKKQFSIDYSVNLSMDAMGTILYHPCLSSLKISLFTTLTGLPCMLPPNFVTDFIIALQMHGNNCATIFTTY